MSENILTVMAVTVAIKVRWTAVNFHQDEDRQLFISIRPEMAHQAQKTPEEPNNLGHKRNHDVTSAAQINRVNLLPETVEF